MLADQQGTLNALASKCQAYSQQRSGAGITPEAAAPASAGAAAEPGAGGLGAGSSGTTPIRTDSFSL